MTDLARKIALTQAIRSMQELFPAEYDFYPRSWILPAQLQSFRDYSQKRPGKFFIAKPDEGECGGRGGQQPWLQGRRARASTC